MYIYIFTILINYNLFILLFWKISFHLMGQKEGWIFFFSLALLKEGWRFVFRTSCCLLFEWRGLGYDKAWSVKIMARPCCLLHLVYFEICAPSITLCHAPSCIVSFFFFFFFIIFPLNLLYYNFYSIFKEMKLVFIICERKLIHYVKLELMISSGSKLFFLNINIW